MKTNKIIDIMYDLLDILNKKGFTLYYYKAYSTSSVYIKLDLGLCGSLRIADHKGIEKYKYKFNLIVNSNKSYTEDGRNYYCLNDIDKLVKDIISYKNEQQDRFGFNYFSLMVKNRNDADNKKGFWEKATNYNDNF